MNIWKIFELLGGKRNISKHKIIEQRYDFQEVTSLT